MGNSGSNCFNDEEEDLKRRRAHLSPQKTSKQIPVNKIVESPAKPPEKVPEEPVHQEEEEENDVEENQKLLRTITLLKLKANNLLLANQISEWKLAEKTKELKLLRDSLIDLPVGEQNTAEIPAPIVLPQPVSNNIKEPSPLPVPVAPVSNKVTTPSVAVSVPAPVVVPTTAAVARTTTTATTKPVLPSLAKVPVEMSQTEAKQAEAKPSSPNAPAEYKKAVMKNANNLNASLTPTSSKSLITPPNSEAKKSAPPVSSMSSLSQGITPPNSEAKASGVSNYVNDSKLGRKSSKSVEPSRVTQQPKSAGDVESRQPRSRSRDPFQSPKYDEIIDSHAINYDPNDSIVDNVREQLKRWKESPMPDEDNILKESISHSKVLSPEHILLEDMAVRETVADSAVSWARPSPQRIRTPQKMSWKEKEEEESPPAISEIEYVSSLCPLPPSSLSNTHISPPIFSFLFLF
jgi:hypothetical protein